MGRRAESRGTLTAVPPAPRATGSDPGLFGPASEAWALDREAWLLLGAGTRALLLQLAHPLVAEGVDQHSGFRVDPWARLAGTLRSTLTIVFGTTTEARAELGRLNRFHRPIRGDVRDPVARARFGDTYDAAAPELRLWVWATLVDSTMAVTEAWVAPLPRARRARLHDELRPIGRALGVPDSLLPRDLEAFDAYRGASLAPGGPIVVTPTARELSRFVLRPPMGPAIPGSGPVASAARRVVSVVPGWAHAWLQWPSIGLLPPRIRDEYGLAWGPRERAVSAWLVASWRAWAPRFPASLRWFPQAVAAERRLAGSSVGRLAVSSPGASPPRARSGLHPMTQRTGFPPARGG